MERRHAERQLHKDLFISFLAIVSVAIGLYDIARPRTSARLTWLDILDLAIVFVFVVEFTWSAFRSGKPGTYAKQHWYEIPSLIPLTGNMIVGAEFVPLLRGLRLVRLFRVVRLLRVIGALGRFDDFWRRAFRIARRAHVGRIVVFGASVIVVGACLAWLFEGPHNPRFASFWNALWWAVNMLSNVAYVDFQPATGAGRLIAGILEFTGIAFIGLFTASLANAFFREDEEKEATEPGEDAPLD